MAVIGAGAAGTMTAARLLDAAATARLPLEVVLIDPAAENGRGPAYSTTDTRHLLNVPAERMSADPGRPEDFLDWLRDREPATAPGTFAPRAHYGAYLADHLRQSVRRAADTRLRRLRDRAVHAEARPDGRVTLRLASGGGLTAEAVVLATGAHAPGTDWAPEELRDSPRFVADPWAPGALADVPEGADVLLVGTGLTMADVAVTLERPDRTVHAVSRNGLLPQEHAPAPAAGPVTAPDLTGVTGLPALRAAVLRHVARTRRTHGDWRPALDSLRPLTTTLWRQLTAGDRARFLGEDLRLWEVHRHRMPAAVAARIAEARRGGRLAVRAAEVTAAKPDGDLLRVEFAGGDAVTVGAVVNCTGPRNDARAARDPLLGSLLDGDLARPGPHGLGLGTGPDGRLRGGRPGTRMWTLGAPRRGELWETTAVPEIRTQAAAVAAAVVEALGTAPATRRSTPTDRYGLRLTTTLDAAAAYNRALDSILRVTCGAEENLKEAVAADPGFALGHATLALLGHEWGADVDVPAALAAAGEAAARGCDARERSFVAAAASAVAGGSSALLRHIDDHPRDALAVSLAVPTIAFGGVTCGEQTWDLVERLAPAYGDDWWYQGQLAFVRQEQERWDEAEELTVRALAAEPGSGHAVHARTHVFYETGRHTEGLAWIDRWIDAEGRRANNRAHFSWHAALHELATGDTDAVRARYLTQLAPPTVTGARALVDSGALLWRCRMTGAWDGPLPAEAVLAGAPEGWRTEPPTPFAALHAAVTLAAAGDGAALLRLRARAGAHGDPVFRDVVAPLCAALSAVVDEDWAAALPALRALLPLVPALGGSAAQRDVVEETLLFALVSAGRHEEAAALLDARLDRRPSPLDRLRRGSLRTAS
ncbi:hypothetical protein SMD11_1680 [Streptomyces albireticuli]|uniref:FAD-dependent urate hydroxylase HpyO/Asp monooxygenase CreE-like FAD/NAD(P)-binding domain-containing protein n=1 Tax=Streptomyces albireticuli TaxID=1940 RepID=A0A1Z2KZG5_9ACTN|nr:hypothetical protein SMD11_1680 [Streptomyces albireticuli]